MGITGDPSDPIRFLGRSLQSECWGFYDTDPATGQVTIPDPTVHLYLHGCSSELRYGGICTTNTPHTAPTP